MPEIQKKRVEFKELPDPIKTWLASTQITLLVSDLNKRLGFKEEGKMRVIPTLILRLAISDITPNRFISELSKLLGVSPELAKSIAQEIEEKMLRPIEIILRNQLGIDIKLIHVSPSAAPMPPRPTPIVPPMPPRPTPQAQSTSPTMPIIKVPINITESKPALPPIPPREEKS